MAARGLDALIAERTAAWTPAERAALATVVEKLQPSPRHLTDILDWLEDIAVRDGERAGAVLRHPDLVGVLGARGSAPDRLKRWKETLRRLRYPRLVARERAAAALVRAMELGSDVTVRMPSALEGSTVTLTIAADSTAALAAALRRIEERLADGSLDRLFATLV